MISLVERAVETRKLDVGAGAMREEGFETMDISPVYSPDFQHDLTNLPWPFADGTFEYIKCFHVMEHLERRFMVPVMNEMYRVLADDGTLEIEVPIFPFWTAIADPTHVSFFVPQTFAYFCTADSYRKAMRGSTIDVDHTDHRKLYGIKTWTLEKAYRDEMGSILRVKMGKA